MLNSAPSVPGLDFHLGETVNLLRQNVADFAAREIAPRAAESIARIPFRRKFGSDWVNSDCWV